VEGPLGALPAIVTGVSVTLGFLHAHHRSFRSALLWFFPPFAAVHGVATALASDLLRGLLVAVVSFPLFGLAVYAGRAALRWLDGRSDRS
jgi:hypothetical protein